jgi:hypothetical protein
MGLSLLLPPLVSSAGSLSVNDEVLRIANLSIRPWIQSSIVVGAIKRQNARHASISQSQIAELNQRWQDELAVGFGRQELVDTMLGSPLSQFLVEKQEQSLGLITDLVVMDNKGLNVGISHPIKTCWQGDKDIWQESFGAGINRTFVSAMQKQPGNRNFQIYVSYSIADPATGKNIGAIAVGINVEKLIALSLAE